MKAALLALTDRGMLTAQHIGDVLPFSVSPDFFIHKKALGFNQKQCEELEHEQDWGYNQDNAHNKNHDDWHGREFTQIIGQVQGQIKTVNQDNLHAFKRLGDVVPKLWGEYSVLIFVMAAGIVVRQISSLIERKDRDPAVLVLDEEGKFVIPLLSGHLGGANSWAKEIAQQIGAQAVITTATDGRGLVAPDEYARRNGWKVEPINHLPVVNRLLLEQGFLQVWTSYPLSSEHTWVKDSHYRFVLENEKDKANVILDAFPSKTIREDCLYLIPPMLSVGVGCCRGVSSETILARIKAAVEQIGASPKAISGIYSINLKADEAGLIEAAKHLRVPFRTFTANELQAVNEQKQLNRSNFVNEKIGVDGVCEAASLLGVHNGRLILPKTIGQGVTVAISMENSLSSASDQETLTI